MRNSKFILTALAAMFMQGAYAQQPYGGCWHPEDIKNWSPETDPDAKFNRSRVPLATRFQEPTLMKANKNQYYEGQICNATILFPTCPMSPSQGAYNFLGYQPTYWQYMDKLVYWFGFRGYHHPATGRIDRCCSPERCEVVGTDILPSGSIRWHTDMGSSDAHKRERRVYLRQETLRDCQVYGLRRMVYQ